jgi:uncharacterized protein YdeI (YjbR/CyaY-like superfamily)
MIKKVIANGTVHGMPADLRKALTASPKAQTIWNDLTPLARNEWICWNTFVKQPKTRQLHIRRTVAELQEGKRRPCCWLGCIHRKDKPISPSVQGILNKR